MSRRETPLDAARIVRAFEEHGVDYVMIGGLAVQAHGHVRTTQDADIVPAPGAGNRDALVAALRTLGARPLRGAGSEGATIDAALLESAGTIELDTEAGGVDIHGAPTGAAPYAELRERATMLEVLGTSIPFVALDDLIAMKRASGRPIDIGDIAALTNDEGEAGREPQ